MSSVRSRSAPPELSFFENCICASRQVCCGSAINRAGPWSSLFDTLLNPAVGGSRGERAPPWCRRRKAPDRNPVHEVGSGQSGEELEHEENLDQATKGTRWMPRRQEAKKDVG